MSSTSVGTIQYLIEVDTSTMKAQLRSVDKEVGDSADRTATRSNKAFESIGKIGLASLAAATVAVSAMIIKNIGGAIQRIDTLNNASRTFQNLGFSSDDTSKSMDALKKSILGLPTPLDSAVRGMTALASTYGNISQGQKVFTALNNAILGFGGTADEVSNAVMQLSQLPLDGPLDAQTWNSLRNSGLTPVLVAMSKGMGMSVSAMKEAFGDGTLKVQDFNDALVKMNTEGAGGMKSLEKIAKDSTSGIGTSWANLNTAITRGLANLIEAVGSKQIAEGLNNIGKAFENGLSKSSGFINFIKSNKDFIAPVIVAITSMVTALTAWYVATKLVAAAQLALDAIQKASTIGLIIVAVIGLVAAFMYLWNNVEGFRNFFIGVWGGMKAAVDTTVTFIKGVWDGVSTKATEAWTSIKKTVKDVMDSIKGWINSHKQDIINWSIVIGTILLPKIVAIGVQFALTAAQAVAQAAVASAAWIASAAASSFAWVTTELPKIVLGFIATTASAVAQAALTTAAWVASSVETLIGWGISFAGYLIGVAAMVGATLIAAGEMVIAWMLALGPIGLIIAAVIGMAALIVLNWDWIKEKAGEAWDWIKNAVSGTVNWIVDAFNKVKNAAGSVWNWITGAFGTIGTIVAGAFKGAINGVLGWIERTINGFINLVNGAIGLINKIPGVHLGNIGNISVPRLAEGGIVPATQGGRLAVIGEGGKDEAVIPLDKLEGMMSGGSGVTINIQMDGVMTRSRSDLREVAKDMISAVNEELRSKGVAQIGNGAI